MDQKTIDSKLKIMEMVETELEHQKGEATFCLTLFLCALSVWILSVALWEELGKPIDVDYMKYGVELIALLMLVIILKFTRLDLKKMGVTKQNLKPAMIRASIISALIIIVMLILKPKGTPLNWSEFEVQYILTAIAQEYLARGFLLTTLLKINTSKNSVHIAVICSSFIFACLHLYYGFSYMIGAGLLSILLGYCYLKDENIWGVSLIHFVFGMAGLITGLV